MIPIAISEEQKEKLLEMSKALFPEYGDVELSIEPEYDGSEYHIRFTKSDYIHWFEFCLMHLAEKVLNNGSLSDHVTTEYASWTEAALIEQVHPIDYLYTKFKELCL